jgi:phosphoribosylformylglycinamidine synthase I
VEGRTIMTRALVLRAPGINCDRETAYACRRVGFSTDLLHINQLIRAPGRLLDYDLLVIPGGFSYGDDLGAGTLLAKNLSVHLGVQLERFIGEGRLILGICNGFQVLVKAGLIPGRVAPDEHKNVAASLIENASAQFECRWVTLSVRRSVCIFTRGIDRPLELPVAHGEGRFVLGKADSDVLAQLDGQVPLVYAARAGDDAIYPDNPNGSIAGIAGVCNASGTIFGLMPHPERYVSALQHPRRKGLANGKGDGLLIFENAYMYARTLPAGRQTPVPAAEVAAGPAEHAAYAASGVDIAAADAAKELMQAAVKATQGPEVLAGMGAFAGVLDAGGIQRMNRPALVASTDGVGTKTLIAARAGRFDTLGYDLVNHSVNDLLTQGARPLFFMDYLAMGKLDPTQAATIVRSVAEACREVGCALLGGETAEMPDVYLEGAFDLAGTIVGVVEQDAVINGATIAPGDVIAGLPSSGLHTNGYSLARRAFAAYALDTVFPELGEPLADALLRPHRCYQHAITRIRSYLAERGYSIKGMAHITGGGMKGNISRILPQGTRAVIDTSAWAVPPLFALLARLGRVSSTEMYRALNMGIGMVLVLSPQGALEAMKSCPQLLTIGHITAGDGVVLQ